MALNSLIFYLCQWICSGNSIKECVFPSNTMLHPITFYVPNLQIEEPTGEVFLFLLVTESTGLYPTDLPLAIQVTRVRSRHTETVVDAMELKYIMNFHRSLLLLRVVVWGIISRKQYQPTQLLHTSSTYIIIITSIRRIPRLFRCVFSHFWG